MTPHLKTRTPPPNTHLPPTSLMNLYQHKNPQDGSSWAEGVPARPSVSGAEGEIPQPHTLCSGELHQVS